MSLRTPKATPVADLVTEAGSSRPVVAVGTLAVQPAQAAQGARVHLAGTQQVGGRPLFQIGSITKTVTALALATAVVRGEVDLDDPVAPLLPEVEAWPRGAPITLRELATHTAGLPRIPPGQWHKVLTRDQDPYADLDAPVLYRNLAKTRLHARGRMRYSNYGYGLLGHALAERAGTTWEELVQREVLRPLGMADTTSQPPAAAEAGDAERLRVLTGHRRSGVPREVAWTFADAMAGCGALWSTVEDMLAYLQAQLQPPEGVLGEAVRLTHSEGLAWMPLPRMSRTSGWFHNGGTYGFRSIALFTADAATVVLTNSDRAVDGLGFQILAQLSR